MQASGLAFSQLLLLLLSVGGTSNDLVSLFDAQAYFEARGVEKSVGKMLELALKTGDGKAQIMQLLAIRRLGEDFPKARAKVIQALTPIAQGKQAQDPHGFAREYAIRALRRLGANMALPAQKGDRQLKKDLLAWFPGDVKVVGAAFVASAAEADPKTEEHLRQLIKKMIPAREFNQIYDFADKVGNVRADAVGFGMLPVDNEPAKTRIYLHLKGKADAPRFAGVLAELIPNGRLEKEKDAKGATILLVSSPNDAPAYAFIGDTDLLVAGYGRNTGNHLELLRQMLKVRGEGKGSVLTGHLADELKKVAPEAIAFVVGALSADARRGFGGGLGVPLPTPQRVHLEATRSDKGINLSLAGTYENEDQAKEFADGLAKVNKQAVEALGKLPKEKLPAELNKLVRTTLKSFQVEAKGKTVMLRSQVPAALLKALPDLLIRWFTLGEMQGAPVQKIEKKGGEARLRLTTPAGAIPCLHEARKTA